MPRVEITEPQNYLFKTDLSVRISDINYGGHLGNDALLSIAHEARIRFLASHGYKELDICGLGIIMADSAIIYQSEAFLGESLCIEIGIDDARRSSFDMIYKVTSEKDGRPVAIIKTGILFFDYTEKKVRQIPEEFRNRFLAT